MAQEQTVTVQYVVFCGKPTDDGFMRRFDYEAQAPASLCVPHFDNGPKPDPDATGVFLTSLVEAHHEEILQSQAWRCIICNKPAKELLHSAIPFLSPVADRASPDFVPSVINTCTPICFSGGACDRAAEKLSHDNAKTALIQKPWQQWDDSKTCNTCGKKSGVKLCGGCKVIAYCSKECQTQDWPTHKRQCRRAQMEARKTS